MPQLNKFNKLSDVKACNTCSLVLPGFPAFLWVTSNSQCGKRLYTPKKINYRFQTNTHTGNGRFYQSKILFILDNVTHRYPHFSKNPEKWK